MTLRGHVAPVYQICWSSDSRMLISASKDSTLKIWNIKTKKIKFDLPGHLDEVEILYIIYMCICICNKCLYQYTEYVKFYDFAMFMVLIGVPMVKRL